jgi:hypothetical protein
MEARSVNIPDASRRELSKESLRQQAVLTPVIVPSSRKRTTGHSLISELVTAARPFRIAFTSLVNSRHVSHST